MVIVPHLVAGGPTAGRAHRSPPAASAPAVSQRRFAEMAAAAAGVPVPKLSRMTKPMLWLAGLFVPAAREIIEMAYEFEEPFLLDCSKIERAYRLQPTPLEEALTQTVAWWRGHLATGKAAQAPGAR
jgi:nucleoside-diphosphate-sugar epimerase